MDEKEKRARIEKAREREECPNCGKQLTSKRVGSGSFADGVFCGLDCLASFHADYFQERRDYGSPSDN
jgi:ribosomal protein L37AE/L43A